MAGELSESPTNEQGKFRVPVVIDPTIASNSLSSIYEIADKIVEYISAKVLKDIKGEVDGLDKKEVTTNNTETETASTARERDSKHMEKIRSSLNTIADVGVGYIKKTFGLVEMVFNQLKKSSPLLQAIEQLFNLAWTLFFMPIGNKLGEMLIPAVIQLMDDVMEIWDSFEGLSLSEMLGKAIELGVVMLADFIDNIANTLEGQSGFVGSIANMLSFVGDFLRNHGEKLLNVIGSVASFILSHLKEIIALIIAFKAASYAIGIAQIVATYQAPTFSNIFSEGGTGALKAGLTIAGLSAAIGGATYIGMNAFAKGGHVNATPGGQLAIVGEGGEGEWIIPDSKMSQIGGGTYNVNIYSYSTEELTSKVEQIVSGQISASRLRSGF